MGVVFIGTPPFAVPCLRRLVGDGYDVTGVITQPDRPAGRGRRTAPSAVKLAAGELGLHILQPATLRDAGVIAQISELAPEVIVAVAYGQILRREVLDIPPRGVLNIHPSLLPRWRGASPIPAAILAGDEETGVTIMLMDSGMDSGPILVQRPWPVEPGDTAGTLSDKLSRVGGDLLAETLPRWLAGEIEPQPQDESQATKSLLLRKEDGVIDWSLAAVDIWRRVRAYNPWPGAYTTLDKDLIHIWQAWPVATDTGQEPGTIVAPEPHEIPEIAGGGRPFTFAVQTGSGLLAIEETQRAGRRAMSAAEFLRGMPTILGRRLGSSGDAAPARPEALEG